VVDNILEEASHAPPFMLCVGSLQELEVEYLCELGEVLEKTFLRTEHDSRMAFAYGVCPAGEASHLSSFGFRRITPKSLWQEKHQYAR
jgi:hypothetical protein